MAFAAVARVAPAVGGNVAIFDVTSLIADGPGVFNFAHGLPFAPDFVMFLHGAAADVAIDAFVAIAGANVALTREGAAVNLTGIVLVGRLFGMMR